MTIDYEKADTLFRSKYWSPDKGHQYDLILANWRLEERQKFKEKSDEPDEMETCMAFDVIKVDDQEFVGSPKVWQSASYTLYEKLKPVLQAAEAKEYGQVVVSVELSKSGQYHVVDLRKVRDIIDNRKTTGV